MRSFTFLCSAPVIKSNTNSARSDSPGYRFAKGAVHLNGNALKRGDGAATDEPNLVIKAAEDSEILLFDLA